MCAYDQSIITPAAKACAAIGHTQVAIMHAQVANVTWVHVSTSDASVLLPQPPDRLMPVRLVAPLPRLVLPSHVLWEKVQMPLLPRPKPPPPLGLHLH
jgi:hypothetical protein